MKKLLLLAVLAMMICVSVKAEFTDAKLGIYPGSPFSSVDLVNLTPRQARATLGINFKYFTYYLGFTAGALQVKSGEMQDLQIFIDSIRAIGGTPIIICNPYDGLEVINNGSLDADMMALAIFLGSYQTEILISFGPEMNGSWHSAWGQKSSEYKLAFQRVSQSLKKVNPLIKMCWVANWAKGYPWGNTSLDPAGAYSDYFPGDADVDYVGLNFYYKDWEMEDVVPNWFWHNTMELDDFYQIYVINHNHPMIVSESSHLDPHLNSSNSSTRVALSDEQQRAFKTQYLLGVKALMDCHPRLEIFCFFHTVKNEPCSDSLHDFGVITIDYRLPFDVLSEVIVVAMPGMAAVAYPNPCYDLLTISNLPKDQIVKVQIINLLNKIVKEEYISGGSGTIKMSDLPANIYFCQINSRQNKQVIKIIHFK